jgi:uncharacterized membrane protein YidH (DUF202 family)
MNIIDIAFYCILNITAYQSSPCMTPRKVLGFITAIYILSRMVFFYLRTCCRLKLICYRDNEKVKEVKKKGQYLGKVKKCSIVSQFSHIKINEGEVEFSLEGINQNIEPWKRVYIAKINFVFRFQLLILPFIIIAGQSMKCVTCLTILATQIAVVLFYFNLRRKFKSPVFSSWLHLMSFTSICSILVIVSVLGLYLEEWHTVEYIEDNRLPQTGKPINNLVTLLIILLILGSILLEVVKGITEIVLKQKNIQRRKYF